MQRIDTALLGHHRLQLRQTGFFLLGPLTRCLARDQQQIALITSMKEGIGITAIVLDPDPGA